VLRVGGVAELMQAGVITNSCKPIDAGKTICTFAMGNGKLFSFLDRNPAVEFKNVSYTNDPNVIARNSKFVAINSALEVDVTGQICAESIGTALFTGTGGQLDFALGASIAPKGKFIIAMPSTANGGKISRIWPCSRRGGRHHLEDAGRYVVTSTALRAAVRTAPRAKALIANGHDFRERVERDAKEERTSTCRDPAGYHFIMLGIRSKPGMSMGRRRRRTTRDVDREGLTTFSGASWRSRRP
jgi:acyl-CoA hydrolase